MQRPPFKIRTLADFDQDTYFREQAALFRGSHYGSIQSLRPELLDELEVVLSGDSEEAIQRLLTANPYLLQYVVPESGHHGIWVFPKQMIRTRTATGVPGLIPDFLVVTAGSLGYRWQIIELKTAKVQFAKSSGKSYTPTAAAGIAQCATYRAHFANYVETVRSNVGIDDIIVPANVILIIGDASTETDNERICRSEFDSLNASMMVASFDRIRRGLRSDLAFRRRAQ